MTHSRHVINGSIKKKMFKLDKGETELYPARPGTLQTEISHYHCPLTTAIKSFLVFWLFVNPAHFSFAYPQQHHERLIKCFAEIQTHSTVNSGLLLQEYIKETGRRRENSPMWLAPCHPVPVLVTATLSSRSSQIKPPVTNSCPRRTTRLPFYSLHF